MTDSHINIEHLPRGKKIVQVRRGNKIETSVRDDHHIDPLHALVAFLVVLGALFFYSQGNKEPMPPKDDGQAPTEQEAELPVSDEGDIFRQQQ